MSWLLFLCLLVPDPGFQAHFEKRAGWLGADGAYSIPVRDGILWLFSDTFIGRLNADGSLGPGSKMIHNSWGWQKTAQSPLELHPEEIFPGWNWVYDGAQVGDRVLVFLGQFERAPGPPGFDFRQSGSALAELHGKVRGGRGQGPPWTQSRGDARSAPLDQMVRSIPHFRPGPPVLHWGAALLRQDDLWYIYGTQDHAKRKDLVVARSPDLEDFAAWRFWDGKGWVERADDAAVILADVANELSVFWHRGKLQVLTESGRIVRLHEGSSPWGPFGEGRVVLELEDLPGVFYYNAKAHPENVTSEGILVTVNQNLESWDRMMREPRLYRPRCYRLKL